MKIIIFGGSGTLGLELVKILTERNHKVFSISKNNPPKELINKNIQYISLDLKTLNLAELPKDFDAIYYIAQSRLYKDFPNSWQDIFEINIKIPLEIISWAKENKIPHFFYASSGGVYSNITISANEYLEINANKDLGFYMGSKLSAELLLRNFSPYFNNFVILRPFFIYGSSQEKNMFIPRIIEKIKNGSEITLNNDLGIIFNPIYSSDAANACANLLNLKGTHFINIGGREVTNLKEISLLVGRILNKNPILKKINQKETCLVGNIEYMERHLWIPKVSLEKGIEKVINLSN